MRFIKDFFQRGRTDQPYFLGIRTSAWIEVLAFFFIMIAITFFFGFKINFYGISPHPFWIIIILMTAQYGTNEGLLAALFASIIYLAGPHAAREFLESPAQYFASVVALPVIWFMAALILGEIRMRHLRSEIELKKIAKEAEEKEKKIADSYNALKKLKERLELRVASEMETTLSAINAFKRLEETSPEGILKGAVELTKTIVAPEQFSIFLLENGELKCAITNGWGEYFPYRTQFSAETPLFKAIVEEKNTISILSEISVLGNEGALAVPIIAFPSNEVFGMIKIEQIPFTRLRTATIESLREIGEWVGHAYQNIIIKRGKIGT